MELVTAVLGDHGQRPHEDYGKILVILNSIVFLDSFEKHIPNWKMHYKMENLIHIVTYKRMNFTVSLSELF
jgi:hypothetical protein